MKNNIVWFILLILPVFFLTGCSDDDDINVLGKWSRVSDFDGLARSGASSFTIENKGYIVGGYNAKTHMNDLWVYDMDKNSWEQKTSMPGKARKWAVAFAVNGRGYYGTGHDGDNSSLSDFWEYNPVTDTWTQMPDFPGTARYGAVAFGLSRKGYVGCGYDGNYLKDFYSFDPVDKSWKQIVSIGGSKRRDATSFVVDDVAYICCGQNNGEFIADFWKFNQSDETWTQLRDIKDTQDSKHDDKYAIVRIYGVPLVMDGFAYLTCGEMRGNLHNDTWKYNPADDLWEKVAKFKGALRTEAVSFYNNKKAFVATGKSGTYRFDDIWTFNPYEYDKDKY